MVRLYHISISVYGQGLVAVKFVVQIRCCGDN